VKLESKLQVADARDAYLRWNAQKYDSMSGFLGDEFARFVRLIPLFIQINHKLLPGYTGNATPAGIHGYKPDKKTLDEAALLNNKFRYQQEGVLKNSAIDAIYFQRKLIDQSTCCWVFYRSSLSKEQVLELSEKLKKISQWFSARGHKLKILCLSESGFQNNTEYTGHKNKSIFLDYFYSETILLAGKYPLWWLVPPDKETQYHAFVDHINQARFVDNDDFIDLGSTHDLSRADFVKYAIDQVQKIKQSPEICVVELLLIDVRNSALPAVDGVSARVKGLLYNESESIEPLEVVVEIMHSAFSSYAPDSHIIKPARLFSILKNTSGKLSYELIDTFLGQTAYQKLESHTGIEKIFLSLNLFKSLMHEIRQIFSNITKTYSEEKDTSLTAPALVEMSKNMLVFLSENSDSVPIYNKDTSDIILDRVLLRHEITGEEKNLWSLVLLTAEGEEKTIGGFNGLLGLLAWCWLNRLVNHSTQVSIDCPRQQIKQTEARFMLEVLMQQLNPDLISVISPQAFENPARPLQSLLFVNSNESHYKDIKVTASDDPLSFGNGSMNLITHCEQLIVNSWGDVYTKLYTGDAGILQCLCEWTHYTPLDCPAKPQQIKVFGHGVGDSTYLAQRVDQVYKEMLEFFYSARQQPGRFIVRLSGNYYVVTAENKLLSPHKTGNHRQLMEFLEAPLKNFQKTEMERLAYAEYPFSEIYKANKENVFQVFFQLINKNCFTWVLDERGTLWQDVSDMFERESYITHWLYTFRNFSNRLKKIHSEKSKSPLPGLEINQLGYNQLGGLEFNAIGAEAVSGNIPFLDLQVIIEDQDNVDQLSLICNGRVFDYKKYKHNVLIECVQYLSSRMIAEGKQAVYVTDIDAPLKLFNVSHQDDVQLSHLLKLKRKFERKIYKLLEGG